MSQTLTLSDEAYQALAALARLRGETPETLIEAWIATAQVTQNSPNEPKYQTFDEFFRDLGMSDEQIEQAKVRAQDADADVR